MSTEFEEARALPPSLATGTQIPSSATLAVLTSSRLSHASTARDGDNTHVHAGLLMRYTFYTAFIESLYRVLFVLFIDNPQQEVDMDTVLEAVIDAYQKAIRSVALVDICGHLAPVYNALIAGSVQQTSLNVEQLQPLIESFSIRAAFQFLNINIRNIIARVASHVAIFVASYDIHPFLSKLRLGRAVPTQPTSENVEFILRKSSSQFSVKECNKCILTNLSQLLDNELATLSVEFKRQDHPVRQLSVPESVYTETLMTARAKLLDVSSTFELENMSYACTTTFRLNGIQPEGALYT
jgi:hypothetical protein